MDFLTLKDKFILQHEDYSNDVLNFMNYMQNIYELNLPKHQDALVNSMRTELIIDSLEYYVNIGQIKKQEPAKKYFVAIGQLFEFVLANSEYSNDNLEKELANPPSREDSYSRKTSEFVLSNLLLQPKEAMPALDYRKIITLIGWCDKFIENDIKRIKKSQHNNITRFRRSTACLCMKLMLLTGVTYREARKIEFKDLNAAESSIRINGYVIRLPKRLSIQFALYYDLRSQFGPESQYLFCDNDGKQWEGATSSSGIPTYMKTAIEETSVTAIIKYGISQLIKNRINDSVIMKLTGANKEVLNDCLDSNTSDENDWEKYINSRIVNTELYYKL